VERRITRSWQTVSERFSTAKCRPDTASLTPVCGSTFRQLEPTPTPIAASFAANLDFPAPSKTTFFNPLLIVEVLSPSTEGYDRGKKFELYRTLANFREYLIVHQDRRRVEHYSMQDDGSWLLREHSGGGGSVAIDRLGVEISHADLYASAMNCD
jgi:Uma2 family endonuclease